ncbi:MAG: NADH-quinone oxidoreductase subunit NuoK [Actinobacteria bacterium]|nr:NADH-quinone oxidoreductase subunit NuoK [Actinomycetota bacterium]
MGLEYYLALSAIFFGIGLYGALTRRNAVAVLLSIEIMLNGATLNLVSFSRFTPAKSTGQVFTLFIMAVAAAEVAVGLALVFALYRAAKTVDVDEIDMLRG